ncbi:hypothetical protein Slala04_22020 [Streptomyces lavendulae subsp. lavendulae]|nr:hypothetical protein Slala04_22020 [Streptomyces lavendulae subsp. lavendulae]
MFRRLGIPLTPIPSAISPHAVEQAQCRVSGWSMPLYEQPGRPMPCLLGSAWVDGRWDGSAPLLHPTGQHPHAARKATRLAGIQQPAGLTSRTVIARAIRAVVRYAGFRLQVPFTAVF